MFVFAHLVNRTRLLFIFGCLLKKRTYTNFSLHNSKIVRRTISSLAQRCRYLQFLTGASAPQHRRSFQGAGGARPPKFFFSSGDYTPRVQKFLVIYIFDPPKILKFFSIYIFDPPKPISKLRHCSQLSLWLPSLPTFNIFSSTTPELNIFNSKPDFSQFFQLGSGVLTDTTHLQL